MHRQVMVLTLGIAITGSNSLLLSPILADVAAGVDTTPVVVSRALAAYGGATALSALLLAPRLDRLGARRTLAAGMCGLATAMLISATAWHWLVLVLAQTVAGLAAGVVLPSTYMLATAIAPRGEEARLLGRVLAGWSIALVLGVPASALATDLVGWRSPFLVLAALATVTLVGVVSLPRDRTAPIAPQQGLLISLTYPGVAALLLVCLAYMAAFYGTYAFVGDALRAAAGASAAVAGLVVLAYGVGFGLASAADGWLDRVSPQRALPWMLLALGGIYLALPPAVSSVWAAAGTTLVWGFVNHLGLNALLVLLSRAHPERRGSVLGLYSAVTYLAAMLGTAGAAVLYQHGSFGAVGLVAASLVTLAGLAELSRHAPDARSRSDGALTGRRAGS